MEAFLADLLKTHLERPLHLFLFNDRGAVSVIVSECNFEIFDFKLGGFKVLRKIIEKFPDVQQSVEFLP